MRKPRRHRKPNTLIREICLSDDYALKGKEDTLTGLSITAYEDDPKCQLSSKDIIGGGHVKAWNDVESI